MKLVKIENPVLEKGVFQFAPTLAFDDGKEIKGNHAISVDIKSADCQVLTPQLKITKNFVVKFENSVAQYIVVTVQNGDELLDINLNLADFDGWDGNATATETEDVQPVAEESLTLVEAEDKPIQETTAKEVVEINSKYPVVKDIYQVDFGYVFTHQIRAILALHKKYGKWVEHLDELDEQAQDLVRQALKTPRIMFFRDTSVNCFYWITKDKILFENDPVHLAIQVNEYNGYGE